MKIKKQHRKKKYLHKLNRKRMRNNLRSTGVVACKVMKEAWDHRKSSVRNLKEMGLANDPNKAIKIPSFKEQQLKRAKQMVHSSDSELEEEQPKVIPLKVNIALKLEEEANLPRQRRFKLPKGQVEFITYLLDKYGHDYKAMTKDKKNYYQETWKQLRSKVKTFMGIPKQYAEYLKARGKLDNDDDEELKKQAKAFMDDSD